ncbi:MAG: Fe-S cluster assembly protein SufD, partial [Acidimicrobiales bacterium]
GGTRLVLVNGRFEPGLSMTSGLPDGVRVTSLASVLAEGDRLRPYFSRDHAAYRDAFGALNTALFSDGACVELAPDSTVREPIEIVYLTDASSGPILSSPRSLVLAGPKSAATLVETHVGLTGQRYCTNGVTEVVLESGAHLAHYKIQDEAEDAFHLASLSVHQGEDSRYASVHIALGSKIARDEVRVALVGERAEVDLAGLYLPRQSQHHDHPILVEHAAPRTTSRQLYKGIADQHGHGVFNGHVVVRPGAIGTDAVQTNRNLLLSDTAEIDTRPRLEIFTDDVACAHGAAVGRLDEDALFYLRSRGISERDARGLLTYGFATEIVERVAPLAVRAWVDGLVAARLGADAAGCSLAKRERAIGSLP